MLNDLKSLPEDPVELKGLVTLLASELKNRDLKIADLKHQLAGHNRHRFGSSSETIEQLQLSLENGEIAVAAEATHIPEPEVNEPKKSRSVNRCLSIWSAMSRCSHPEMIAASVVEA